jgi:hypothetical protein
MTDDTPRARPGVDLVESWFFRLNDPSAPRALWVRATALTRADGSATAEAWAAVFDGDGAAAHRQPAPYDTARFDDGRLVVADTETDLRAGTSRGSVGSIAWDLRFEPVPGPLGAPLRLLPDRLVDAPLPKNKLVTPMPAGVFRGTITWGARRYAVDRWVGMRGHNWGPAHAPQYAWGHAVFLDEAGAPFALVEGASGRLQLGRRQSPVLSVLAVRHGERTYRWDRVVDLWRQRPAISPPGWTLTMRGRYGRAELAAELVPERCVSLRYDDPSGDARVCTNSKTARLTLRVQPSDGDAFVCTTNHGAALEFLQRERLPGAPAVV